MATVDEGGLVGSILTTGSAWLPVLHRDAPPQTTSAPTVSLEGRLRVLHVSEVVWGGVPSLLRHFVAEQAAAGHDVHLLGPEAMPAFPGATRHVWRVDRHRPWTVAAALHDLRRTLTIVRPDVVHLHSFVAGLLGRPPGQRAVLGLSAPVVYQPHAWSFDLFTRDALSRAVRWSELRSRRHTDVVVANCTEEIDEGRRIGIDLPARALGVAVDLERFSPVSSAERDDCRRRMGIDAANVVVCVGRLGWQKGQDLLLPVWERTPLTDTQLVLVGPGDPEPLRALAPTRWGRGVLAVGEVSDVRPWLWAADVIVLPSRYEGEAVTVAEALACGRPVVATAVNGAAATIVRGPRPAAGAVVGVGDMDSLVSEVIRRTQDPALRRREGIAGRRRAEALFAPAAVAGRLEMAYRDAITMFPRRVAR